jgi:succinate-acetate transporter protein
LSIQPNETSVTTLPPVADPGPLGLAAFALTTFLVSAFNAHWTRGTTAFLPFALGYGGLVQLLAGMWEFKRNNVFAATAFGTYGGFWIGVFFYFQLVAPHAASAAQIDNDLGWIFLAFAIFNTYMLLWSTQVNKAVFGVFLTLEVTEIFLFIGNFSSNSSTIKIGGVIGIVTAVVAWYASAAGVINGMRGTPFLPVGKPFGMKPVTRAD